MFDRIHQLYGTLLLSKETITLRDYGAGSRKSANSTILGTIAKNATSPSWKGRELHHISMFVKPTITLELGTNLGIGTAYLASASKCQQVHTVEGDPSLHQMAKGHWQHLGLTNIESHCGEFLTTIPLVLKSLDQSIDLLYLDGNHRKESTIAYVELLKPHLSDKAVIIVDDIQWSSGMYEAWEILISNYNFNYSLNMGQYGILFCGQGHEESKCHETYIPFKYKPWKIGLFAR